MADLPGAIKIFIKIFTVGLGDSGVGAIVKLAMPPAVSSGSMRTTVSRLVA